MYQELINILENTNARLSSRVNAGKFLFEYPKGAETIINIAFDNNHKLHLNAAWAMEQAVLINPYFLESEFKHYFKNLPVELSDSALRSVAKVTSLMLSNPLLKELFKKLPKKIQSHTVQCAFEWLLGNYRVAVQVHAMETLSRLTDVEEWVKPNLIDWLEVHYQESSGAFQARSRMILKRLK